jgi:pimeloyl-ACP methyl ester carboxylesterase
VPKAVGLDAALYYERHGEDGDPTVLVHGAWVDHRSWSEVVAPLAQGLRTLVYDRRGYGASVGPRGERSVRADADDLAFLLESTNEFPAHLVGQSTGAAVVLRLSIDRPELVRSVAVHAPPFGGLIPPAEPAASEFARTVERLGAAVRLGGPPAAAGSEFRGFGPPATEGLGGRAPERGPTDGDVGRWLAEFADSETTRPDRDEMAAIAVPVLISSGETSPPALHRIEEELAAVLPQAAIRRLPGTGQFPQLSDPGQYAGLLSSFLLERDVPSN